jgi:hypothetical protein
MVDMKVRDHFLLLPMLVVLEGLGVLVPEVMVHNGVQPRSVKVHVFLGVLLVCLTCVTGVERGRLPTYD